MDFSTGGWLIGGRPTGLLIWGDHLFLNYIFFWQWWLINREGIINPHLTLHYIYITQLYNITASTIHWTLVPFPWTLHGAFSYLPPRSWVLLKSAEQKPTDSPGACGRLPLMKLTPRRNTFCKLRLGWKSSHHLPLTIYINHIFAIHSPYICHLPSFTFLFGIHQWLDQGPPGFDAQPVQPRPAA